MTADSRVRTPAGTTHTVDADVIVIGYGPSGMATAAIFDDETMRTFDKLGIAQELLPTLHVQRNYEWRNREGDLLIEHAFADIGRSGWAEWYMMYQPYLEDALDRVCRRSGLVEVRHCSPVVSLAQDDDGVTVRFGTPGGAVEGVARARYAVGCDGGNSSVRRMLGVEQDDYGFSEPWMVCDFALRRPIHIPPALQVGDPEQPMSIISLGPKHHRFSFMVDSEQDFQAESQPEAVWPRVAGYLGPDDADLIRVATYTFRSLIAHRWRTGRVVLAGDAAHQMPPFLGQGMCSGIRDAQNLAFKLDLLLRGRAEPDLLDTYQLEREPHVRAVVEKGIELGRLQTIRDPEAAALRDQRLLAQREARQVPEQIRFPGLAEGLLSRAASSGRGELFIQGDVDDGWQRGRFDEVVGRGFALVTTAGVREELHRAGLIEALTSAGVVTVAVAAPGDGPPLLGTVIDLDGSYLRWFSAHGCSAVAVRPDFYVYGCSERPGSAALATELLHALGAPIRSARPASALAG